MTCAKDILEQMPHLHKPAITFLSSLLCAMSTFVGKANRTNLHRFDAPHPRTQARWQRRDFISWLDFNCRIAPLNPDSQVQLFALDTSFVHKSGKHTYGKGPFYSSKYNRTLAGLEVSLLARIDQDQRQAWALDAQQSQPVKRGQSQKKRF